MVTDNEPNQYNYAAKTYSEDFIHKVFPSLGLFPLHQSLFY